MLQRAQRPPERERAQHCERPPKRLVRAVCKLDRGHTVAGRLAAGAAEGGGLLTGALPTELGLLTKVEEFTLEGHRFTGPAPTELGMLSNLRRGFSLSNDHLGGPMPTQLGRFSRLQVR